MKIGSGGQEASHVALRGEKQLSYSKHHGFIQICYFELNVISELLWNELPFTHCLTHNTCGGGERSDFLERRKKKNHNDEEQQSMGWVEAVLERGVVRCWRWSMCGTKRKAKRKGCCHLTILSVNKTSKSTKRCCTSVSKCCLHRPCRVNLWSSVLHCPGSN